MKIFATTALIGSLVLTSSANAGNCHTAKQKDIVDTAVAAGSFKTLAAALGAADLAGALKSKGPFTVFAPTDAAFAKLPKGLIKDLLKPENKSKLQAILKYHVVQGKIGLSDALAAKNAKTLQGAPVQIAFKNGKVNVNGATLVSADIKASNGVIHVIDSVILPPEPKNDIASVAKKAGKFNTLLAAVEAAGLSEALTGKQKLTVLAPTDAAFKALPKGTVESLLKSENRNKLKSILSLHVVSGKVSAGDALNAKTAKSLSGDKLRFGIDKGVFKVNGAKIIITDIKCDNGIIHVIDTVLLPKTTKKAQQASANPAQMIQAAIEKGVPVFNHGNHGKCADIYQQTLVSLTNNSNVSCNVRKSLSEVVARAQKTSCDTTRAWMLRAGLDHAHTAMSSN
ncbi:MAG: fasciclin domain-containing protein [Akkermansiaceae bacterium]